MVSPKFWTGTTGKLLRKDRDAQVLALYLMTCPHANMIGVYHLPVAYVSADTGIPFEGALKGLARLSQAGFLDYDDASETVFVYRMAEWQIGKALKANDNRVGAVEKQVCDVAVARFATAFRRMYAEAYGIAPAPETDSPSEAPCKPLPSQEQEQDQEQEQERASRKRSATTYRTWLESLGDDPPIPDSDPVFAYAESVGLPTDYVELAWHWFDETYAGPRRAKRYSDWRQVFRNAVEGGWPKAWFIGEDGSYGLTTTGKQLLRKMEARDGR